jgi:topoisomerase-4 subunit B
VVIMTDADVDGAHIAALLMTFFFREMPQLIADGHLYLAQPPLFRISAGGDIAYARDEADRDALIARRFKGRKVEISRFKGLGEMAARQLKETTMDPTTRTLERVEIDPASGTLAGELVEQLMGRRPELRLAFIQANAREVEELDV